jgi:DNA-binding transcriptional regulator YdaS (Cro superfamily)
VEQCIAIERETAGAVTVEELRPDIDWSVIRGRPAKEAA